MTDLVVLVDPTYEEPVDDETQILERSVTLTNEQWSILAMCEIGRESWRERVCLQV